MQGEILEILAAIDQGQDLFTVDTATLWVDALEGIWIVCNVI